MHQESISRKADALFGDRIRESEALCTQVNALPRGKLTVGILTYFGSMLSSGEGT